MSMTSLFYPFRRQAPSIVVPLRGERAEQCAALQARTFAHAWSAVEFETLILSPASEGLAAVDPVRGDALMGFVLSRRAADEAEILTFAVEPALHGRGIGRALLAEHIARLNAAGTKALFLEVEIGNAAARALYARLGFFEVGQRRGYYRSAGSAATALVLRRELT
jgi:ribosomal-protein-alanine N-acetyltransferase